MLLYEEDEKHRDNTPGVWLLILINIGVFIYEKSLSEIQIKAFVDQWGLVPARVVGHFDLQALQSCFASMFMHGGFSHLFGNMLFLYVFGDNIENRMGFLKFLLFYFVCGLVADSADVLLRHDQLIASIGASGAISGVLGAYFMLYPAAVIRLWLSFLPPIAFSVPAYTLIGFWFIIQVVFQFVDLNSGHVESGGIAWMAHIGGFLAGIVLVNVLAKKEVEVSDEAQLREEIEAVDEAKRHRRYRITYDTRQGQSAFYPILATSLVALIVPAVIIGFLSFSAVKTIGTGNPVAYVEYTLGRWYASSQKYIDAKKHYDKALALAPRSARLYFERGCVELELSQLESAMRDFRAAEQSGSHIPELGIYLGNCAFRLAKYDEALKYLNKYIEANPDSAAALCNRGWVLNQLSKYDKAMEDFTKAEKLNPNLEGTYCGMGACLYYQKKYTQAIEKLDRAIRMSSSDYIAYYYRGLANAELHQLERALQDLSKAIELQGSAAHYSARAQVYMFMNRYKEAVSDLSAAIALKPDAPVIAMRGQCYKKLGQMKLAEQDFLRAKKMNSKTHLAPKKTKSRTKLKTRQKLH